MGVAHLALDLGAGCEGRHRVDDDDVDRPRPAEHVGDLERLLTGVGLRDQQLVDIDTDRPGVDRIHRVLGVDVGTDATVALCLGHDVHGEGGLAGRLRTVDLGDPPTGQATDAEREVEGERPGGDRLDVHVRAVAHLHDGALAELLVDLGQGHVEGFVAVSVHCGVSLSVGTNSMEPTVRRGCDSGGGAE